MTEPSALGKGYHIYTGDGKGKTTAALGLCFRAAGHGLRSLVLSFMKDDRYGEVQAAAKMEGLVTIRGRGRPTFVDRDSPNAEDVRLAREALREAAEAAAGGDYQIVVLDEICVAVDYGLVPLEEVLGLIAGKPAGVELVLTGRNAHPEMVMAADLVTECLMIRHYFEQGVGARQGVEV